MRSDRHRNWLLTIAEIRAAPILWFAGTVTVLVVAATYRFEPVYTAKTTLAFDSSLRNVLSEVTLGYPSATARDYIRYEFFASHNINVMRAPEIAVELVGRHDLRDRSGKRLLPEYLVEPSMFKLLFNNRGQGVSVRWIADTQQFGISGFSTDPEQAILLAREYTDIFLDRDSHQFHDLIEQLRERVRKEVAASAARQVEINTTMQRALREHHTADPVSESEALNEKLQLLVNRIEETTLARARFQGQMGHLVAEIDRADAPVVYQRMMEANPQAMALKVLIQELTGSLVEVGLDFTPEHPRYKALKERLADAKERLRLEAETTLAEEASKVPEIIASIQDRMLDLVLDNLASESTIAHCDRLIDETNVRLTELLELRDELSVLTVERTALSTTLEANYQDLRTISGILENPVPGFRIVSEPRIDGADLKHYKFFPKRKRLLAMTLIAMCILGTLVVVARELHFDAVYRFWQAAPGGSSVVSTELPDRPWHIVKLDPHDARMVRCISPVTVSLRDCSPVRVLSMEPDEGRATVARVLASELAALGRSVVMVEGDVRARSLSAVLGVADAPGLTDCLAAGGVVDGAALIDVGEGIRFMPAGTPGTGRVPVWSSLRGLLLSLGERFDSVLYVDAPLTAGSPAAAASLPDHGVVLVARSGRHSIHDISSALDLAAQLKAVAAAVVVNRVPFRAEFFTPSGLLQLLLHLAMGPLHAIPCLLGWGRRCLRNRG